MIPRTISAIPASPTRYQSQRKWVGIGPDIVSCGRSARRLRYLATMRHRGRRRRPVLDELEAEPTLDAQMAVGHRRVHRRGHLDDLVVLDVERERAADAAVRADRVGHGLGRLVPRAGLAHLVLGPEHQGAGRADADAVAAVDAGRVGQPDVPLGRDPGVEPAPGDRDRERVLGIDAARLDALVAEDALRVVADVQLVVDLDRLGDGRRGRLAVGGMVVAGLVGVALAGRRRASRGCRTARDRPRSARAYAASEPSGAAARPARRRPTSRAARSRACASGGPARSRSGPPSRARPCASRRARGRARP